MRRWQVTLLGLALAHALTVGTAAAGPTVHVACTRDRRIEVLALDPSSGALRALQTLTLAGGPGAMATSPDRRRLYVATYRRDGRERVHEIVTLARAADGTLRRLAAARVQTRAVYLRVEPAGRFLLTASYGDGSASVYRIRDGTVTATRVDHEVSQRTAHAIELSPDGRHAYVPHTAPNRVYQYGFDAATGQLAALAPPFVTGPADDQRFHQPRHIRFHPRVPTLALTSNERGGGLSSWRRDPETGQLTLLHTVCTLPTSFKGKSAAAQLRLTPDGRFAYVSNRDLAKAADGQDTLACVAVKDDGSLRVVGHAATVRFPRAFAIAPSGRYLYAAGQRDDRLGCFRIDPATGGLTRVATIPTGGQPSWVEIVE